MVTRQVATAWDLMIDPPGDPAGKKPQPSMMNQLGVAAAAGFTIEIDCHDSIVPNHGTSVMEIRNDRSMTTDVLVYTYGTKKTKQEMCGSTGKSRKKKEKIDKH